jgi:hypothetical protein
MRSLFWLVAACVFLAFSPAAMTAPSPDTSATLKKRPAAKSGAKRAVAKRTLHRRPALKRRSARRYGPYGFLPGYRPPEVVEYENEMRARRRPFYALPYPRFYRGRWNGGGFGECYTYTPIGPVWNCGR